MRLVTGLALLARMLFCQTSNPDELFRRAVAAQQSGDYPTAISQYQQLLRLRPDFVEALANLGAALAHEGRFDEAIANDRTALKLHPGNAAIQSNLALAFYKKGDFASAARQFESLLRTRPGDVRISILLAQCYLQLRQDSQCIALLEPLAKENSENLDLLYALGTAMVHTGQRKEGATLLDRVARQGNSAEAYMLAGSSWLDLNAFDQARQDLDSALRLNPALPGLHTLCGVVRDKMGDPRAAEPELRLALAADPNDFQANLTLGAIFYKERNLADAKRFLDRAIALNPSSTLARFELALVEGSSGELEAAVQNLEVITRSDPNWLEPHVQLAALYYKVHRAADGLKERQIVDKLTADPQRKSVEP